MLLSPYSRIPEKGKLVQAIGRVVPIEGAIPALIELEKTGIPKGKLVVAPGR